MRHQFGDSFENKTTDGCHSDFRFT